VSNEASAEWGKVAGLYIGGMDVADGASRSTKDRLQAETWGRKPKRTTGCGKGRARDKLENVGGEGYLRAPEVRLVTKVRGVEHTR